MTIVIFVIYTMITKKRYHKKSERERMNERKKTTGDLFDEEEENTK